MCCSNCHWLALYKSIFLRRRFVMPFTCFKAFAFEKFVWFCWNITEFKVFSQPSGVFSAGGTWNRQWCWSLLARIVFTWLNKGQNGISEVRKWVLVSSLLVICICNYLLVFTEEIHPNSLYRRKTFEEITYTGLIMRNVCFNNVSGCLVAWHISF